MLWICAHCGYNRVSWRPRAMTEAQVSAVARAHCQGKQTRALQKARGFVFIRKHYMLDEPIRCPCCGQKFFPGDSLARVADASASAAGQGGPNHHLVG